MAEATKTPTKPVQTPPKPEAKPEVKATNGEAPAAPPKPKRVSTQIVHKTAEAATADAAGRETGPRKAYTCTFQGKEVHVVATDYHCAGYAAFKELGGTVDQIGKAARAAKTVSPDGILASINGLPEAERAKVLEQLKAMVGAK